MSSSSPDAEQQQQSPASAYTPMHHSYHSSMAVVAARDRVDYSMAKGGLRYWTVMFVFLALCSSLYAVVNNIQTEDGLSFTSLTNAMHDDQLGSAKGKHTYTPIVSVTKQLVYLQCTYKEIVQWYVP